MYENDPFIPVSMDGFPIYHGLSTPLALTYKRAIAVSFVEGLFPVTDALNPPPFGAGSPVAITATS